MKYILFILVLAWFGWTAIKWDNPKGDRVSAVLGVLALIAFFALIAYAPKGY